MIRFANHDDTDLTISILRLLNMTSEELLKFVEKNSIPNSQGKQFRQQMRSTAIGHLLYLSVGLEPDIKSLIVHSSHKCCRDKTRLHTNRSYCYTTLLEDCRVNTDLKASTDILYTYAVPSLITAQIYGQFPCPSTENIEQFLHLTSDNKILKAYLWRITRAIRYIHVCLTYKLNPDEFTVRQYIIHKLGLSPDFAPQMAEHALKFFNK